MNEQTLSPRLSRFFGASLAETDPVIAAAIGAERYRQQDGIELIASASIVSAAALQAQGSVLTNKYAGGLPGKRSYGGCGEVDVVELLTIERARELFGWLKVVPQEMSEDIFAAELCQAHPDARKAPDGHWHVGDPNRPGNFLQAIRKPQAGLGLEPGDDTPDSQSSQL